jgi:hypothetical protein
LFYSHHCLMRAEWGRESQKRGPDLVVRSDSQKREARRSQLVSAFDNIAMRINQDNRIRSTRAP